MKQKGEDLYEKHAENVYRYLFSLIGEADTAEELTQETFYQALKSMNTYRGDSTPQVWLCAIAKRLWFKELERRKRTICVDGSSFSHIAASDDLARAYEERNDRFALYQAMQQLDSDTERSYICAWQEIFHSATLEIYLDTARFGQEFVSIGEKEALVKMIGGGKNE